MYLRMILLIFILTSSFLFGQDKLLTLEEAILGSRSSLKIDNIQQLQWQADSDNYTFVDSLDGQLALLSAKTGGHSTMLLSLDTLNSKLENLGFKIQTTFPTINWLDEKVFHFKLENSLLKYQLEGSELSVPNEWEANVEHIDICAHSWKVAYVKNNNLFITDNDKQTTQITFDTTPGISNGNNTVHRNEFGISKGTFWSPKGNFLAYYHLDRSKVTEFPLVDLESRPAKERRIRYPMAGMVSEEVRLAVYNSATGSTVYLQTGEPRDQYLTQVTWSPDEQFIYVTHLNRDQNHLRMIQYDAANGMPLSTVVEEKNEHWIEPDQSPIFLPESNDQFLWFSRQEGFNQLYLYRINGKRVRKLFKENIDLTGFLSFDHNSKYVFLSAASADAMERHIYRIKISSGRTDKVSRASGIHRAKFSSNGLYYIDTFSNSSNPREITLHKTGTQEKWTLLSAENPLADYKLGDVQFQKIVNVHNDQLNARIILPIDFDPQKKYPVIVYVYGGPHGQMITNNWISGWPLWYQYMAQQGYIVFTLDNRGTNNRGLKFEQAIHRELGTIELEDQMAGIDYLKSLAYVDSTRIGVHGWSYGGFMTISMLTRHPGIFKVGVAGGPVIDWRYYEIMYGERYMDTPQGNFDGYEKANLLNYVDNLNAKLLIIHGAVDPVVVWQNSLLYLRKAIDLGKQLDFFVYPGDEHNMRGQDRLHLYQKITDYFKLHL